MDFLEGRIDLSQKTRLYTESHFNSKYGAVIGGIHEIDDIL